MKDTVHPGRSGRRESTGEGCSGGRSENSPFDSRHGKLLHVTSEPDLANDTRIIIETQRYRSVIARTCRRESSNRTILALDLYRSGNLDRYRLAIQLAKRLTPAIGLIESTDLTSLSHGV
jgi:hypothetical protein